MNALVVAPTAADLVTLAGGEPRISSTTIAQHTATEHQHIVRLIRANESDLLELGDFPAVETGKSTGGRPAQHYLLNEPQAALIMSNLRNSDVVRAFRLKMIKAFVAMAQQLRAPALPQTYEAALETLLIQVRQNTALTAQIRAKEAQLEEAQPKLLHYDRTMFFGDTCSIDEAAKVLGYPPNRFRLYLRNHDWIVKVYNREVPKQDKINAGHMTTKVTTFGPSARFNPSGVEAVGAQIERVKAQHPERYAAVFG